MNRNYFSENNPEHNKPKKSYYDILGISANATDEEIRVAYRKKAKETHPDLPKNRGREEEFLLIGQAYEVLSDSQKRKVYDSKLIIRPTTGGSQSRGFKKTGGFDIDPSFGLDDLFNTEGHFKQPRSSQEKSNKTENAGTPTGHKNLKVVNSGSVYYLFDAEKKKNISSFYDRIDILDEAIIGHKGSNIKVLLDPTTGREISKWYQNIEVVDNGYAAGEYTSGAWYLLSIKTGKELSGFYKKIYKKDGKIFGHNGSWEQELKV